MHFVYKDKDGKYHRCEGGVDKAAPGADQTVYGPSSLEPLYKIFRVYVAMKDAMDAQRVAYVRDEPEADAPTIVKGE